MRVLNAEPIYHTTKRKQSQTKLFAVKKETLDPFETLLTHSKVRCVTLSEYNNTQKHLFRMVEPFGTIISYARPVDQ
jgi:hypothetical protein